MWAAFLSIEVSFKYWMITVFDENFTKSSAKFEKPHL